MVLYKGRGAAFFGAATNRIMQELLQLVTPYVLARDHLQQAAAILRGTDMRSRELLSILERTISLIDDLPEKPTRPQGNVLDFVQFKSRQLPDI